MPPSGKTEKGKSIVVAKQGEYGVEYKRYWVDEKAGKVFCLVQAPDAETAARVHKEAHGLVADEASSRHRFVDLRGVRVTASR